MSIIRTEEEQKRANEMFDAFRDELLKRELSNTESYDRAILSLSAASLGISVTAIQFVVPLGAATHIWMIKFGWLLLLISVGISLYAYFISNAAISEQMKNAESYYLHGVEEAFNRPNRKIDLNSHLNKITGFTFIIAVSFILLFVILNIGQENQGMKKGGNIGSPSVSTTGRDSASVPMMQKVPSTSGPKTNSANIPTMQQAPGTPATSQGGSNASGGSGSGSSK